MRLIPIDLPEYVIDREPDIDRVSNAIDDVIKREFMGKSVVVRGVASSAHPDKTIDELVDIIASKGTDRYDPNRVGDRYENIEGKHIDFFGVPADVSDTSRIMQVIIWGFYHSAQEIHGQPMKIDVVTIYDAHQLDQVVHQYEGRDDIKDDGFAFKYPDHKVDSLVGIIKIS